MKKIIIIAFVSFFSNLTNAQNIYELIDKKDYKTLSIVTKKVNTYNSVGEFPLFYATSKNDTAALKILIQNGADVNQITKNHHNNSACITYASQEGYVSIIKILLDNNVNINFIGVHGCTPLRIAARNGQTDVVRFLIASGA
jgi:ankyrin repeat protein